MTDKEIKEAVEYLINQYNIDETNLLNDNLQTLVDLGKLYLSTAGKMPDAQYVLVSDSYSDSDVTIAYKQGYNQSRQECILAYAKREQELKEGLLSVEEIVDIMLRFRPLTGCFNEETFVEWEKFFTTIATAIHERLEKGKND